MARPYTPDTLADRWDCSPETVRQMIGFCGKKQSLHRPECGFMQAIPVRTGSLCQKALPKAADFQSVANPARSATWPPAERQTAPGGSMGCVGFVKPMEGC